MFGVWAWLSIALSLQKQINVVVWFIETVPLPASWEWLNSLMPSLYASKISFERELNLYKNTRGMLVHLWMHL